MQLPPRSSWTKEQFRHCSLIRKLITGQSRKHSATEQSMPNDCLHLSVPFSLSDQYPQFLQERSRLICKSLFFFLFPLQKARNHALRVLHVRPKNIRMYVLSKVQSDVLPRNKLLLNSVEKENEYLWGPTPTQDQPADRWHVSGYHLTNCMCVIFFRWVYFTHLIL